MLSDLLTAGVRAMAVLPAIYYLAATRTARTFFTHSTLESAANRRSDFTPPVSVLKPVRGLDRRAVEHFTSFCRQDYPDYELLFAVADSDDEAIPVLRQLAADFPERSIQVIAGVAAVGSSSKVNKLCRLAREASHEIVVISDSDITVPRNYLRSVVAPFRDPDVGAVTCLYRAAPASGVWAHLEAIGISTDFAPGVIVARWLEGVKFTLGATMATRKARLSEIGGFEALADYCADDFELGRRIAGHGHRIELTACTVSTEAAPRGFGDFFRHQLRWAITLRHSRPGAYVGRTLVTQGLPWALAAAVLAPSAAWAAAHLLTYATCRFWMARTVGVHGLQDDTVRRWWPLIPVYDAAACVVAIVALGVNRIEWRGRHFKMRRGRLIPIA